jgi:4-aminobutyrate aminotransferase-like enzyme
MTTHGPFESIVTPIPGPRSLALAEKLRRFEARAITYLAPDYPVFWESASGATVTDVDGNRYLDLTSAFAVAATGHTNPAVADAVAAQAHRLIHGMGDVYPTAARADLVERLAALAPGDLDTVYLATGGAEAIEVALKTAYLATGKPRVLAFEGAYHGLTLGTLDVIGIPKFRDPFAPLVGSRATFMPYPDARDGSLVGTLFDIMLTLESEPDIGAILLEPIQGRGGVIVPPVGFLQGLRTICSERGIMLVLDEIFTGFGRTGTRFACEREGVVPDLLCVGKALAGGVPIAAVIGRAPVMRAWPENTGEALHTATFLGNPLACAAALANLDEMDRLDVIGRVQHGAAHLQERLERIATLPAVRDLRGRGYFWGLEFGDGAIANRIVVRALAAGLIILQSGPTGTSITITPPLVIADEQLDRALDILERIVREENA